MLLLNAIVFDLIWLGLVYVGNDFVPMAMALLAVHILFVCENAHRETRLIFSVAIIGVGVDFILNLLGIFNFPNTELIPLWLICLWFCFAATLNHSIRFLAGSKVLQILVGAILAPLSYVAGYKLGVVAFSLSVLQTYLLLSLVWSLLMLMFFQIKSILEYKEVSHA